MIYLSCGLVVLVLGYWVVFLLLLWYFVVVAFNVLRTSIIIISRRYMNLYPAPVRFCSSNLNNFKVTFNFMHALLHSFHELISLVSYLTYIHGLWNNFSTTFSSYIYPKIWLEAHVTLTNDVRWPNSSRLHHLGEKSTPYKYMISGFMKSFIFGIKLISSFSLLHTIALMHWELLFRAVHVNVL